jgi:RNA polymerase sigma-70 factor (ECF subfamily)
MPIQLRKKKSVPRRVDGRADPPEPAAPGPFIHDSASFERLVHRYQGLLFKYVYNIFRDYHLAQDITQEVFIKVYASLTGYNVKYPFSTWLLRVAHNYAIDYLRRRKLHLVSLEFKVGDTRVSDSLAASLPAASRAYEISREREQIKEAIFSLDPDYRSVIFLRYIEGVTLEDISYILGIPMGTVKSRINRARLMLQRRLRELDLGG